MTTRSTNGVFDYLRRTALRGQAAGVADGHLLECYVARRDEAAFAALVERHGPMVWGVCRRLLANPHDAEDAFQATFLVLVRKAAFVQPREAVGSWLHGVAYRAAQKARATAARRATRERQVTNLPEPATVEEGLCHDLIPVLDGELSRLPEKYRLPVVLCDLEGRTRKEAARQLGWPEGTVAGRLAEGRTRLAKRLARHGLPVSGGVLAAVLSQQAVAAGVLPPLRLSAAKALASMAGGGTFVPAPVTALAAGVMQAMLLARLKIATAAVLMLAVAGSGAGLLAHQAGAAGPAPVAGQEGAKREQPEWEARRDTITLKERGPDEEDPPPRVTAFFERADQANLTVTFRHRGAVLDTVTLPVAADATITWNDKPLRLADLKPGWLLKIMLSADESKVVTIRVKEREVTDVNRP